MANQYEELLHMARETWDYLLVPSRDGYTEDVACNFDAEHPMLEDLRTRYLTDMELGLIGAKVLLEKNMFLDWQEIGSRVRMREFREN